MPGENVPNSILAPFWLPIGSRDICQVQQECGATINIVKKLSLGYKYHYGGIKCPPEFVRIDKIVQIVYLNTHMHTYIYIYIYIYVKLR